jgi:peroxiredoxin
MKPILITLAAAAALAAPGLAAASPAVGKPAPAFQAVGVDGKTHSLAEYKGKTVVLEWTNKDCPYVRKHYNTRNMQSQQGDAVARDVVWLSIISSAPGRQGYLDAAGARSYRSAEKVASTTTLLDPNGTVGKAYDARTTPHMFVIDRAGTLVYMGGIDDRATPWMGDARAAEAEVKSAKPYVKLALADIAAGRAVAEPVTRPYGCSVKYKDEAF